MASRDVVAWAYGGGPADGRHAASRDPGGERHLDRPPARTPLSSGQFPYCSGTLISPTVFLAAAHCDLGRSRVFVTFDSAHSSSSKLYSGMYDADPEHTFQQDDPHDLAVVVLDKPMKA